MVLRVLAVLFCWFSSWVATSQVLRDYNFKHLYSTDKPFSFEWKITRTEKEYVLNYQLQVADTSQAVQVYTLEWELRNSLNEKDGTPITTMPELKNPRSWKQTGVLRFESTDPTQKILMVRIINTAKKLTWIYYKYLPQKPYPYVSGDGPVINSFVSIHQPILLTGFTASTPVIVSHYKNPFPSAAPPFSTSQTKVSKTIKPDSIFSVPAETQLQLHNKGLYLAQQDTASSEGVAFRVEEDYPKFAKLESLSGPLVYICTRQEAEKLKLVGSDKKKFDQLVLSITGNADRARNFMRSYFRRVELANIYFTSYKEGWKTDRGLIYIIFGVPDEVYLFEEREVWEYKNDNAKTRFQFVKSPSLFDPDNFVLIREKKLAEPYYQKVDLWRKARF